jgi:hypothetical protein
VTWLTQQETVGIYHPFLQELVQTKMRHQDDSGITEVDGYLESKGLTMRWTRRAKTLDVKAGRGEPFDMLRVWLGKQMAAW